jgi:hypothetical protein
LRGSDGSGGTKIEHEAFFVLRSATPGRTAKILFLPAIPTWIAYNDWAGGCSYRLPPEAGGGGREARETSYAVHTSTHKPWPRGFIRFPEVGIDGFLQEKAAGTVPINWEITYPEFDYVFANGYAMFSWMAGWGYFDRHFAIWAEQNGYEMDYASMHDIYDNPALLEPYDLIVQVGHDEYHTFEYRQAVDAHLARGGKVMRTGGNLMWKVRWDAENNRQTYYKHGRRKEDPMYEEGKRERLTVGWHHFESPTENPVTTWGVNGHKGVYANTGGATPRGSGGFTVYRNKHWVFEGTDLYYGDILGRIVPVVGWEVDGVDYTFRHGLPYPTGEDDAPDTLEILAFPTGTTPMPMPRISLGRRIIRRAGPLRRPPSVRAWARGPSLTSPMATPRASASTCSGPTARRVASPSLSMAAIGGVSANPTGRIWPPRPWRQAGPWRCRNTAWPPPPASTRSPMRSAPPSTCWRCGSMGRSASQAIRRAGIWPPGWSAATRRCRRAFRRASPMC